MPYKSDRKPAGLRKDGTENQKEGRKVWEMQSEKPVFQGRIMRKVLLDKQTAIEYTSNSLNIKQSVGKARTCLKTEASFGFQAGGVCPGGQVYVIVK